MDAFRYRDAALIVKHTFLEFNCAAPARRRASSDSSLMSSSRCTTKRLSDATDSDCESTAGTTALPSDDEVGEIDVYVEEAREADPPIFSAHFGPPRATCMATHSVQHTTPLGWMWVPVTMRNDLIQQQNTSVMLRNIPNDYTRAMIIDLLDREGFSARYDFLYVPIDFKSGAGRGYAFVNLSSKEDADIFIAHFSGFCRWRIPSRKVAEVSWTHANHQGLAKNLEYYQNSSVMHASVPDEYKPVLFCNGVRVAFPAPTRPVSMPDGLHS